ncbi:MAG TPA: UrcA family protein [Phenylobacterium sp.]
MKTLALSTFALLSVAWPALAAPPAAARPPAVSVAYSDLDLTRAKDAAIMLKRIRQAAVEVCRAGPGNAGNDVETVLRFDACYQAALAGAVSGLNAPKVTEAFAPTPDRRRLVRLP